MNSKAVVFILHLAQCIQYKSSKTLLFVEPTEKCKCCTLDQKFTSIQPKITIKLHFFLGQKTTNSIIEISSPQKHNRTKSVFKREDYHGNKRNKRKTYLFWRKKSRKWRGRSNDNRKLLPLPLICQPHYHHNKGNGWHGRGGIMFQNTSRQLKIHNNNEILMFAYTHTFKKL